MGARRKANWARLIQKVYEVDPLKCLNCGVTMRIIALIYDPICVGISLSDECPLLAESCPSISVKFHDLNDRFGEKRTLHCCFSNAHKNAKYLSVGMTAFHSKADIKLILLKGSANDPKRTFQTAY